MFPYAYQKNPIYAKISVIVHIHISPYVYVIYPYITNSIIRGAGIYLETYSKRHLHWRSFLINILFSHAKRRLI